MLRTAKQSIFVGLGWFLILLGKKILPLVIIPKEEQPLSDKVEVSRKRIDSRHNRLYALLGVEFIATFEFGDMGLSHSNQARKYRAGCRRCRAKKAVFIR